MRHWSNTMSSYEDLKLCFTVEETEECVQMRPSKELKELLCDPNRASTSNLLDIRQIHVHQHLITHLDLSWCNLTGLPTSFKLPHLTNLNLSHNNLSALPLCLYNTFTTSLLYLDLSFNKIVNFDIEPDCVATLKVLKINNNCFRQVPAWFLTFRCVNLEELDYSENKAEHYNFLPHSCNFSIMKWKKLLLRNACLVDSDLNWLKCIKNLQCLDISCSDYNTNNRKFLNRFRDLDQLFVKPRWREIRELVLCNLHISLFPQSIYWLNSLKELHISHNMISWIPHEIHFLTNLEILDVTFNEIIVISDKISQLKSLRVLLVAHNQLEVLPELPEGLEIGDFYDNRIVNLAPNKNIPNKILIDLDCNYIDTYPDYEAYCLKRDKLRTMYNTTNNRSSICKVPEENNYCESSDYSCCDSASGNSSDCCDYVVDCNVNQIDVVEEDWNEECSESETKEKVFCHPDVTLSDQEFDDAYITHKNIVNNNNKKIALFYLDNEDWWFIDAD